jgi:hypothetical protein
MRLEIVVKPNSFARRSAWATVSGGDSRQARNTLASRHTAAGIRSTSVFASCALAPEATLIRFSPSTPTMIRATPDGASVTERK